LNFLQAEKISKSYREVPLFQSLSFSIDKYEKIALIARNGAGKSSLMRILAGEEEPDFGEVNTMKGLRIGFLPQDPALRNDLEVLEQVLYSLPSLSEAIRNYEEAVARHETERLEEAIHEMDRLGAWDAEARIREVLTRLKITDFTQKVGELSGGQRKRIALAAVLVPEPDLLILDEPTNHLDLDMIEWLEEYLGQSHITVLMVTHDRYFLDRVCTEILELNEKILYRYQGNYQVFLDKRRERLELDQRQSDRASSMMKKELDWVNRMPQARGTKPKYRMEAFMKLKEDARRDYSAEMGDIEIQSARMGRKVLDIYGISKAYGDKVLFREFSYKFQRFEKIGMIGPNGAGKSTFLGVITGQISPDTGHAETGSTIRFGHYRQEGIEFNPGDRVIDVITRIAEVAEPVPGQMIGAPQLLDMFLFPRSVQQGLVSRLSGGEKRRLYLLTILMQNPNFLILDEPTNDLDILTLNVLEDYLMRFSGSVIIVSHDRYFMDKVVDHLFVFDGSGEIRDFPGNYSIYRDQMLVEKEKEAKNQAPPEKKEKPRNDQPKTRLSFNERRELDRLTAEIADLEKEKASVENELSSGGSHGSDLVAFSLRHGEILKLLDEKELRWLELSEFDG